MKNAVRFVVAAISIVLLAGLSACDKMPVEGQKGTIEFAITVPDESDGIKSGMKADSMPRIYNLLVSIDDLTGNHVIDTLLPVYGFGSGFVSEKLELGAGEYKLVKFMVINPAGEVLFASPVAGSRMAYLVKHPLPLIFRINPDVVTRLVPEVLKVENTNPEQFGYVSFGISVITPVSFWVAAIADNPASITASLPYTDAKLTVYAADGWSFTFKLRPEVNNLLVRKSEVYKFIAEKEGYLPLKLEVTLMQLLQTTREKPLLLKLQPAITYYKLVLQPGPDDGKDAMISNLEPDKNFGDHKYFEATFLPEPVLTVMRLNRSLIAFNLNQLPKSAIIRKAILRLSFDVPIPFDNSVITSSDKFIGGVFQQVIEPWDEYKVTWNNQPATTEINQVFLPPFTSDKKFIEVDITRLIAPVSTVNLPNYGIKFKLIPEDRFPGFRFASSDHPESALRPMLIIYYTLP